MLSLLLVFFGILHSHAADEGLVRIECSSQEIKVSLTHGEESSTMTIITTNHLNTYSIEAKGIGMPKDALLTTIVRLDLGVFTAVGVAINKDGGVTKNVELVSVPHSFARARRTGVVSFRAQLSGNLVASATGGSKKVVDMQCSPRYEPKPNR